MPRIPKLPGKSLAIKIGLSRGVPLHVMQDRLDADDAMVYCANCDRKQPDPGRRQATCQHCGCQPLPSIAYPKGHSFRPRPREESQQRQIEQAVALRRAEAKR